MLRRQRIRVAIAVLAICGLIGCPPQPRSSLISKQTCASTGISFGQRQLEQMLDDRPDMTHAVSQSHPVRQWLIDGFDGRRAGRRVYWVADSPTSGQPADSKGPDEDGFHFIRVSGGTETSAIDKWASVVFEMANREEDWRTPYLEALNGKLDANGYARKCVALEYSALKKTVAFFRMHPLQPKRRSEDRWYNWVTSEAANLEQTSPDAIAEDGNFEYFKKSYEIRIRPYIRGQSEGNSSE